MKDILNKVNVIRQSGINTTWYEFKEKNKNEESLTVEISIIEYDTNNVDSLPRLWKKHGFTDVLYNSVTWVSCYCTDKDGQCHDKYNPIQKLSEDKKRKVINFDNLLLGSEQNKLVLLEKIYKLFMEGVY